MRWWPRSILQITLTARNKEKGGAVPMCGVPYHAAENYIARLIRAGHKVAICEQMEEPGPGKKIVRREVIRVLTPGTATGAGAGGSEGEQFSGGGGAQRSGGERAVRAGGRRARRARGGRDWTGVRGSIHGRISRDGILRARKRKRGCAMSWEFCGRARCCCRGR